MNVTMMRFLLIAALTLASVDAATKVAVIELGKSGTVHRTTSTYSETSADGVTSFFSALHGYGRKLQHAGMTVVPDLFSRPDSGVIVSLSGVDLDSMPQLESIMSTEGENNVVGHMEVQGCQSSAILKKVKDVDEVDTSSFKEKVEKKSTENGISGVKMTVTSQNSNDVDNQVAALVKSLNKSCKKSGKTVVLHLVVEEDEGSARRRLTSRNLGEEDEGEGEENNNNDKNNEGEDGEDGDNNNGYYGYGYYNAYGEWVTPYKTMFQIQYFNVVLWTSVGLVGILLSSLMLMINMPLMADTLLFGESAKVPLDD